MDCFVASLLTMTVQAKETASILERRWPAGGSSTRAQKKGGRPKAAFKSREETPKEGMCGQSAPHRSNLVVRRGKSKNFSPSGHVNVFRA
jgi:hypothetical protein